MAVRKNDRKEGTLQVLNLATQLAVYTLDKCHNEKVFPKKYRHNFSNRIVNLALDIHCNISAANSLRLDFKNDAAMRKEYQKQAFIDLNKLLGMVRLAEASKCPITTREVGYWAKLIIDTKNALTSWTRSDLKRLENKN